MPAVKGNSSVSSAEGCFESDDSCRIATPEEALVLMQRLKGMALGVLVSIKAQALTLA